MFVLYRVLTRLYGLCCLNKSQKLGSLQMYKRLPKKGSRTDPSNNQPVAITSILCEAMERVLNRRLLVVVLDRRPHLIISVIKSFHFWIIAHATHLWGETVEKCSGQLLTGPGIPIGLDTRIDEFQYTE